MCGTQGGNGLLYHLKSSSGRAVLPEARWGDAPTEDGEQKELFEGFVAGRIDPVQTSPLFDPKMTLRHFVCDRLPGEKDPGSTYVAASGIAEIMFRIYQ